MRSKIREGLSARDAVQATVIAWAKRAGADAADARRIVIPVNMDSSHWGLVIFDMKSIEASKDVTLLAEFTIFPRFALCLPSLTVCSHARHLTPCPQGRLAVRCSNFCAI